jgi:DNA end-binding protein Ku
VSFSEENDIDPIYYEKPYYLEPDKKATHAYALLREALVRTGKVAIAKFVMKDRQHLAAIKTDENILVLNQLRFQDEIRPPEGLLIPKKKKFSKRELSLAEDLINKLTQKFEPEKFKDTYADKLLKIIQAKAKGKKPVVSKKEEDPKGEVFDLMTALKESLEKDKVKTR